MAIPPQRLKDLAKLPVAAEWKHLGLRLDVPLYKLNEIQANHEHSPNFTQDCLSDMFDWWLNNSNDTTYESLACGIRDIEETKLVTCFLQQPSHSEKVYSKLAHALNRIRERDSDNTHNRRWLKHLSLAAVLIVLTAVAIALLYSPSTPCLSKSLPYLLKKEVFVGRQDEIENITRWIEHIPIVSIMGPPGFGKSTLAIHVGHAVCSGGTTVHYINLQDLSRVDILRHYVLLTVQFQDQKQSVDPVLTWTRELRVETLLILDNCDHILHKNQSEFQTLLKNMIKNSPYLKVLLTAKHVVSFLHSFRNFTITELTPEYATELLMVTSKLSNRTLAATIAKLVGNVPLALQVVGKILNERTVESVIKQLQTDQISTLSPKDLPAEDRVVTSLNISYGYLTPENQRCARLLANFPGSFDETAAIVILNHTGIAVSECLNILKYRSLLNIDGNTDHYRFHQLAKEFFRSQGFTVEREQFFDHFAIYYATLYCEVALPDIEAKHHLEGFQILDLERCNFEHLLNMHVSTERHLDILMSCNISNFDILSRVNTSSSGATTNSSCKASD